MKNRTMLAMLALFSNLMLLAVSNDKSGKVSKEELEMSSYTPKARAVVLNKESNLWYNISRTSNSYTMAPCASSCRQRHDQHIGQLVNPAFLH